MKTLNEWLILRMPPKLRDFIRYWDECPSRMDTDHIPYKVMYIMKESCNI
jgi:hypothetical protein